MVAWINKHKLLLRILVILLGLSLLGLLLTFAYLHPAGAARPGTAFSPGPRQGLPPGARDRFAHGARDGFSALDRGWRQMANGYALIAVTSVCALIAVFFLRLSFKYQHPWKELTRWVFRLLQVIHIPLAVIMLVAALGHGIYYLFYHWTPNLESYTGIVALAGVSVASLAGLVLTKWRKSRRVHLVTALCAFALVLIHILS